jgi:hypothetical protein
MGRHIKTDDEAAHKKRICDKMHLQQEKLWRVGAKRTGKYPKEKIE